LILDLCNHGMSSPVVQTAVKQDRIIMIQCSEGWEKWMGLFEGAKARIVS